MNNKEKVKEFWNISSCGEDLYLHGSNDLDSFKNQMKQRYLLEPYILPFGDFQSSKGKKTLEIGVGLGSDHQLFAENGAILYGIDLTERAINNTGNRLSLFNLKSVLSIGDAENLTFEDNFFDIIYSWGVIHHSPNTQKAVNEIYRTLKPGGKAKIMIYHKYSFVGYMLWIRYALMKLKPFISLDNIYSKYLESPGTKAYTISEGKNLFSQFSIVKITTLLTHADLLSSNAGQRHRGNILSLAKLIYPRLIIRKLFPKHGLFMLIDVVK
jgi:ubiquinone/menaquinone biosynthesis C-methylase UbiE